MWKVTSQKWEERRLWPMLDPRLRVAYFPDSFHEVNGVAHTSRQYEAFARRSGLPFLCVRAGNRTEAEQTAGTVTTLELARGPLSFALDKDLRYDPGFPRHVRRIARALREFRPSVVHVTGPSEIGMIGAALAHRMGVPLAASWHTNVHEYAGQRIYWLRRMLPASWGAPLSARVQDAALLLTAKFYRTAEVLFAPNPELCRLLEEATGRPCKLMRRGVDAALFSPEHRRRTDGNDVFMLGYVGRLSIEKNAGLLVRVGEALVARGIRNFRFVIVGQGAEEAMLRERLPQADFRGVLRGDALAAAYADMDLLVFPSHTDTFGNVVLEALASGVPAIVTPDGGPRTIVQEGVTGLIRTDDGFADAVEELMLNPLRHGRMRIQARQAALQASWDSIFEQVCGAYVPLLAGEEVSGRSTRTSLR